MIQNLRNGSVDKGIVVNQILHASREITCTEFRWICRLEKILSGPVWGKEDSIPLFLSPVGNGSAHSKTVGFLTVAQSLRVSDPGPIQDMLDPDIPTM